MYEIYWRKAAENLADAEAAYEAGRNNASASRAYYAAFHAARAVLFAKGFSPSTDHKVVQTMFSNELVNRRKVFPAAYKSYLVDMQKRRGVADYEPVMVSNRDAQLQLKQAREFCSIIEEKIQL